MSKLANEGELREKIRPHCDEILRQGARLYKSGHLFSGRKEVDKELDKIMYLLTSEIEKAKVEAENNNPWRSTKEAMPNEGDFVLARLEYPSGKETHAILEHKTLEDNQPWLEDGYELDFQMTVTHWRYIEELSKLQEEQNV